MPSNRLSLPIPAAVCIFAVAFARITLATQLAELQTQASTIEIWSFDLRATLADAQ